MTTGAIILILLALAAAIGWIPGAVAFSRRHRNATAIMVCGIIGIFVGVFWFVALVWALTDNCEPEPIRRRPGRSGRVRRRRSRIRSRDMDDDQAADALADLMPDE